MNKCKVMMISSVHPVGDPRILHKEAKSLSRVYDVELHAVGTQEDTHQTEVKVVGLPSCQRRFERIFNCWRLFFRGLCSPAVVVHFHDPELMPVCWLLKVLRGKKVVYDVHEDYTKSILSRHWIPEKRRKRIAQIFQKLERWFARRFDAVITVTEDIDRNFHPTVTTIIKNYPLPVQHAENMDRNTVKESCAKSGEGNLVYVGALTRERGIMEIIRALDYIDPGLNAVLFLAGTFDEKAYEEEVLASCKEKKVVYLGQLPHEEIAALLETAKIGLVCLQPVERYKTSLPLKMFEYMAAGIPVVASDFPLWKEIIEDAECGVTVDPTDPESIGKTVEDLLKKPDLAMKMGRRGREAYLQKYNWGTEEKKLLELYARLLGPA